MRRLVHSLTHSYSPAYLLTCLLTYLLTYSFTHSLTCLLTHLLTYSLTLLLPQELAALKYYSNGKIGNLESEVQRLKSELTASKASNNIDEVIKARDTKVLDALKVFLVENGRLTHLLTHSLTYSLTHSLTYLLTYSLLLTHSLACIYRTPATRYSKYVTYVNTSRYLEVIST